MIGKAIQSSHINHECDAGLSESVDLMHVLMSSVGTWEILKAAVTAKLFRVRVNASKLSNNYLIMLE